MGTIKADEPQTALVTAEKINAPAIFGDGETDVILNYIREQCADVLDVVPDVSTDKARKAIKSAAYKVTRSKTILDDAGKDYAAALKAKVQGIDGSRRKIRDELDSLRDEIRKPVDDWEAAEAARIEKIQDAINHLISAGQFTGSSEDVAAKLTEVKAIDISEDTFAEKQGEGAIQKDVAISNLERALTAAEKAEADAAELEALRRQKEKDDAEKAEQARKEAAKEQAAGQERARVEQAEKDTQEAKEAAERAEQEANERAEKAEREAKERVAQAEKEAEERIESERQAREAKEKREKKEEEARAADTEHRRKVNQQAVRLLCEWGRLDEATAKTVVTLIAAGRITNVKMEY